MSDRKWYTCLDRSVIDLRMVAIWKIEKSMHGEGYVITGNINGKTLHVEKCADRLEALNQLKSFLEA